MHDDVIRAMYYGCSSTNHCNNEPSLEDQIIELRQQIAELESWNSKLECGLRFGLEKLKSSDDDMKHYTGMENYAQFQALYDFLDGGVNACPRRTSGVQTTRTFS